MNNLVIPFRGNMGVQTTPPFLNTYSLDFDGVDDYVDCGNISELNGVTEASWSIWAAKNGTSDYYLMSCYSTTGSLQQYLFQQYSDKLYVYLSNSGGTLRLMNRIDYTFNIDEWYHIGIVYNEAELSNADKVKIYINGTLQVNQTTGFALTSLRSTTASTNIGRAVDFTTKEYNGKIDEVAIFDSALTPTEITSISSAPTDLSLLSTPPIAWYRMGDNGAYKSPQWLLPNNENKDKASNYSFEFDGIGDYVELGSLSNLQNATEYSVSSWFKSPLNNLYQAIWSWFDGADGYLQLLLISDGSFVVYNYRTSTAYGLSATGLVSADTWYNALVVFDGGGATNSDRLKLYINGNPITLTYTGTIPTQTGTMLVNTMWLGASNSPNFWGLEGNIDEVSIFDSAISIGDVWDGSGEPTDVSAVSGLMQYYKMGEEANFTSNWLVDNSALDNYSKRSFAFDGIDDYVSIPNNVDLNFTSAYSVSFWVKTTSTALLSPISNQSKFLIRLYAPANQIRLQLYDGSNGFLNLDNTQVFNDGNWHHIAFTTEATTTTDKVIVYFDGVALTNKGTQTNIGSHLSAFPYEIGRNSGTWNFNGGIDEVSLYDSELSASQINDIYNGGTPTTISGALAHWRMGEDSSFDGTNWTVPDNVGSNDGTSNAMTVDDLVGEAPNYSGGGISSGMTIEDRIGEAPNSTDNALSYNMDLVDRTTDVPT